MEYSRAGRKLQEQIAKFSGKLCAGFPKVVGRFVAESIYGIQARGSVRLSEIARSLNEAIPLRKTINRLCYELSRKNLWESLTGAVLAEASRKIGKDTLLVLDLSDITKPYARSMEYMSCVHDGSGGKLGEGYSLCHVIGVECGELGIVPLYSDLYSAIAPDFEGENKKILSAIRAVRKAIGDKGVWVIDRGGDRNNLLYPLVNAGTQFIIRLVGSRNLIFRGKAVLASRLAKTCPTWYSERITKESESGETSYLVSYGFRKVRLPGIDEHLYLLVVNGFGSEPLMILTNRELHKSHKCL